MDDPLRYFPHREFREGQKELLLDLHDSLKDEDVVILSAPTGYGKTSLYISLARMFGKSIIVVPRRDLQDQIEMKYGIFTLKGRRNYVCPLLSNGRNVTADKGPCLLGKFQCPIMNAICSSPGSCDDCPCRYCPYNNRKKTALRIIRSGGVICINPGLLNNFIDECDFLILDEAHIVMRMLMRGVKVSEKPYDIRETLISEEIRVRNEISQLIPRIFNGELNLLEKLSSLMRKIEAIRNLLRFDNLIYYWNDGWIIDYAPYHEEEFMRLLSDGKKLLIVSATPPRIRCRQVKAEKHIIHPSRRPIFFCPIVKFTKKNIEENKDLVYGSIARTIEKISREFISKGITKKVIVHAVSEDHCKEIAKRINLRKVVHEKGNLDENLSEFLLGDYEIFIASSLDTGSDFSTKDIALQFIAKVPYPDLGDPKIRKLRKIMDDFNEWYIRETIDRICQASGRICRGPDDFGCTIILDEKFDSLYKKHKDKFPEWFRDALIRCQRDEITNKVESLLCDMAQNLNRSR